MLCVRVPDVCMSARVGPRPSGQSRRGASRRRAGRSTSMGPRAPINSERSRAESRITCYCITVSEPSRARPRPTPSRADRKRARQAQHSAADLLHVVQACPQRAPALYQPVRQHGHMLFQARSRVPSRIASVCTCPHPATSKVVPAPAPLALSLCLGWRVE